jgi:beta-glucosidase
VGLPSPTVDPPTIGRAQGGTDKLFVSGGDRRSLRLSDSDEALIAAATAVSDRVVVVVMSGSAVVMPWVDEPSATLMVWYPGMEGGHALGDMLTGRAEPGGRLPFAVPAAEVDLVPFDPDAERATYGLFHGQWWLDRNGVGAHFPFGWGLGYTTWSIGSGAADFSAGRTRGRVEVSLTNEGDRPGSTVAMVFAGRPESAHARPHRRLVGFAKVEAPPGTTVTTTVDVDLAALAVRVDGAWVQEPGAYELDLGLRAHDPAAVRLAVTV